MVELTLETGQPGPEETMIVRNEKGPRLTVNRPLDLMELPEEAF